jgi:hypothetical protein
LISPHTATAALREAARLAECTAQRIVVLHVIHDPAEMPGTYGQVTKKGSWYESRTSHAKRSICRRRLISDLVEHA